MSRAVSGVYIALDGVGSTGPADGDATVVQVVRGTYTARRMRAAASCSLLSALLPLRSGAHAHAQHMREWLM